MERCQVCEFPSRKIYRHYNGLVCFKCKAFFKYCHDHGNVDPSGNISYKCKGSGTGCEIHYQGKMCKKCRFDKCVEIGMDFKLIKQGMQRHKYTRKKLLGFKHTPYERIVQAHRSSLAAIIQPNNLTRFLKDGHRPGIHWTKRHSEAMLEVLNLHELVVIDLVTKLDLFKSLGSHDQKILTDNNAKLYKFYIMARYLTQMNTDKITQLSWLLGPDSGSDWDLRQKNFMEINRWAQLIPHKRHHKMLPRNEIFKRCLNTILEDYQYPQSFSGILGLLIILATDHWADETKAQLKDLEKVRTMQSKAEDLFLQAWNEQDQRTSTGQLACLIDNLNLMSIVSNVQDCFQAEKSMPRISSEFCTSVENQYAANCILVYQDTCQRNQMTEPMIQCVLDTSRDNYDLYQQVKYDIFGLQKKRFSDIMAAHGYVLDTQTLQTILMFCYCKIGSFYSIRDHIQWATGNVDLQFNPDDYVQSHSRACSVYEMFKFDGAFVGKEKEAVEFKEITEELAAFVEIEDISHLFMFNLLFEGKSPQHQYQRVLTKKLAENCETLGAESGDEALMTMTNLFKEYLTITEKLLSDIQ